MLVAPGSAGWLPCNGCPGRSLFHLVAPLPSCGLKIILESSKQQTGRKKKKDGIAAT